MSQPSAESTQPASEDATSHDQKRNQTNKDAHATSYRPTVKDMQNDSVTALAETWTKSEASAQDYDAQLIERVFQDELLKHDFSITKLTLLEVSQYLEKVSRTSLVSKEEPIVTSKKTPRGALAGPSI